MGENIVSGITESGFEYSYDKRVLSDWRFMELLAAIGGKTTEDIDRVNSYTRLVTMLLGEKQKTALLEHVAKENDGFAPMNKVEKILTEILNGSAESEIKN